MTSHTCDDETCRLCAICYAETGREVCADTCAHWAELREDDEDEAFVPLVEDEEAALEDAAFQD